MYRLLPVAVLPARQPMLGRPGPGDEADEGVQEHWARGTARQKSKPGW